jgi:hypothetical protein
MTKETFYICTECGFHGTDDQFDRHVLSEGYDYGHNNAAPEEVELQCPKCGLFEEDGIVEAEYCDYCDDWFPSDDITHLDNSCNACVGCKVKQKIMKGETDA